MTRRRPRPKSMTIYPKGVFCLESEWFGLGSSVSVLSALKLLKESDYQSLRKARYASFDAGKGRDFEKGKLTLAGLRDYAKKTGEPAQISGQQERYEQIINDYI